MRRGGPPGIADDDGHDDDGGDLGGPVGGGAGSAEGGDVGGYRKQDPRADDDGSQRRLAGAGEPPAEATHDTEERKGADTGEAAVRAGGMARPLPFHAHRQANQCRDDQVQREREIKHDRQW